MDTESHKTDGKDTAILDRAIRPESNNWQMQYILTTHWQTDLEFFEDELRFFRDLIDKYFLHLIDEELMENTRKQVHQLAKLQTQRAILERSVTRHLKHLGNLVENPFPYNAQAYRDEHAKLEISVADYLKSFRQLKRDIFALLNTVLESEKANHLLKG